MTTANATTDGTGAMLYSPNTTGGFRARKLYDSNDQSIWNRNVKHKETMLGNLLSTKYDMLIRHIMEDYNVKITEWVWFGSDAGVQEIIVRKKRHRCYFGRFYVK